MKAKITIDTIKLQLFIDRREFSDLGDLADAAGLSINTINNMRKRHGRWTNQSLAALAGALKCHPFDLLLTTGFAPLESKNPGEPVSLS